MDRSAAAARLRWGGAIVWVETVNRRSGAISLPGAVIATTSGAAETGAPEQHSTTAGETPALASLIIFRAPLLRPDSSTLAVAARGYDGTPTPVWSMSNVALRARWSEDVE